MSKRKKNKKIAKASVAVATTLGMFTITPVMAEGSNMRAVQEESGETSANFHTEKDRIRMYVGMNNEIGSVIRLEHDEFQNLDNGDDVSSWFKNLPDGLTATVQKRENYMKIDAYIVFSGEPKEPFYEIVEAEIPEQYLKNANHSIKVKTNTTFDIALRDVALQDIKVGDTIYTGDRITGINDLNHTNGYRFYFLAADGIFYSNTGYASVSDTLFLDPKGSETNEWLVKEIKSDMNIVTLTETAQSYALNLQNGVAYDEEGNTLSGYIKPGTLVSVAPDKEDVAFQKWTAVHSVQKFEDFYDVDTLLGGNTEKAQFIMPNHAVNLNAVYNYKIIVDGGNAYNYKGEKITASDAGKYVYLKADEKPGYEFVEWKVDGDPIDIDDTTSKETQFYMRSYTAKVKAVYKQIAPTTYQVTVGNDGNGTASADVESVEAGTKVTLTATPKDGYEFKEWEVIQGNVEVKDDTFLMPESDVEVKAIFQEKTVEDEVNDEEKDETAFTIIKTSKSEHILGSKEHMVVTFSTTLEDLTGTKLPNEAYKLTSDAEMTIDSAYLNTLSIGQHKIIIMNNGKPVTLSFTVKEAVKEKDESDVQKDTSRNENTTSVENKKPSHTIKETARQRNDMTLLLAGVAILGGCLMIKQRKKTSTK